MTRPRALWQLLRVPNLFTAAADVLAGFLFVGAGREQLGALLPLLAASICLYAGGVVMNDVCDAAKDAIERPGRPIPSGAISRRRAAWLGAILLGTGAGLCVAIGGPSLGLGLTLTACVVAYDVFLKRTPIGPATMGACRALNLLLGMSVAGSWRSSAGIYAASLIWLYVASVTFFARFEAGVSSRGRLKIGTAGIMVAVIGLVGLQQFVERIEMWYLLLVGVLLGQIAVPALSAIKTCHPAQIQHAVRTAVLSMILFDGCLVFATRGALWTATVLLLLVPSILLAERYRVT